MRKFILTISLLGGLVPSAWCVPQVLNFQGRLLESGALVNGSRTMTFKIFDAASGGSQLFTENRSVNVSTGVFNVLVGDVTTGGVPLSVFDGGDRYIEVQVGAQILPRQRVVSVGYSFRSQSAAFAADSSTAAFAQRAAVADSLSGGSAVSVAAITATTLEVTTITVTSIVATSGTVSGFLKVGKNTIILGETPLTGGVPNTIAFTGGNATIKTQAPSEGSLTLEAGGAQHIVLNPGGNVGIGTVSPGTKLDVAAGGIASGQANTTTGGLTLYNAASSNATILQASDATAAVTYKLPPADGLAGQVLTTDGSGNLSWGTVLFPPPAIAAISPNTGPTAGGTVVTISGSNFRNGVIVRFGGNTSPGVTFSNSSSIQATSPAGVAGSVNVTVQNPDGQSSTFVGGFTYAPPAPCSDGTTGQVFLSGSMHGCNGSVAFSNAGSRCGSGFHLCRMDEHANYSVGTTIVPDRSRWMALSASVVSACQSGTSFFWSLVFPFPGVPDAFTCSTEHCNSGNKPVSGVAVGTQAINCYSTTNCTGAVSPNCQNQATTFFDSNSGTNVPTTMPGAMCCKN